MGNFLAGAIMAFVLFVAMLFVVLTLHDEQRDILDSHNQRITRLQILACGFYQEEDGSISPETRDDVRMNCILETAR